MARQRACALRARGSSATVVAPERCPSGRRGTPGERVYPQGTEGSNPSLSAPKGPVFTRLSSDGGAGFQEGSKESAGRPSAVDAETDGSGVPGFVVNEFRKFLRCGVLAHGFARVRCGDCAFERLVRFSLRGCVPRIAHGLTSLSILRGFRRYRIQPLQPDRGGGRSHYIPGDLSRAAPHRLSGPTRACRVPSPFRLRKKMPYPSGDLGKSGRPKATKEGYGNGEG